MIRTRYSKETKHNPRIKERPLGRRPRSSWLAEHADRLDKRGPLVVLLGGDSLIDFRLRVAQGHLRTDLKPSFWSHAAIVLPSERSQAARKLRHVQLDDLGATADMPVRNAVQHCGLDYVDRAQFKNIAVLRFPVDKTADVVEAAHALQHARLNLDLVGPVLRWLGFALGAQAGNPLLEGHSIPAAAFVEACFARAGVDLSPGVSESVSCPESIWQAALWWNSFYESTERGEDAQHKRERRVGVQGFSCIQQRAAFVAD